MAQPIRFTYETAFARNLGWFTEPEQFALRGKCVAIAGQGGVGGVHLLTLARLGIGAFHIADADTFDLVNFNRQIGATMQTIGRPKVEVLNEMALAINPELRIERFDEGVTIENIDRFLRGVDLFVDGFDFFAIDIRRRVFARCSELGIPSITAAPIGMGTAFLAFSPRGMSFEEYFRLEGQPESEQLIRFLVGLTPKGLQRGYLVDPSRVDLACAAHAFDHRWLRALCRCHGGNRGEDFAWTRWGAVCPIPSALRRVSRSSIGQQTDLW